MWEVAQPHYLGEELEAAGYHRLRRNDRSEDGDNKRWVKHSRRYGVEERVTESLSSRILADIGSLPDISKQEARVGETDPGELNGPSRSRGLVGEELIRPYSVIPSAKRTQVGK
jgi:hypothetical protein